MSKLKDKSNFKQNRKNGFTLLEALIAVVILAVGIISLAKIFPLALQTSRFSQQNTIAANLSQQKMEEIFSLGYQNIDIGNIEIRHHLDDNPQSQFYGYEREAFSEYVDENLANSAIDTGIKKITVNVYWENPLLDQEKKYQTIALISRN